ncbi:MULTISPECIES: MarR family winged helix-turn-helix transcriptional regulator [Anaerococcus]|nr:MULTISPECIES: transcriptional regulator [Anaerococcus]MDY3006823.1 transcriptional regulator [Anaerococcus porci]
MNYELRAFIGISRLKNSIDKRSSKLMREYDLSLPQFAVMEALYSKGDMCIGEVKKKILSTSGTMPIIVRNLKKKDYIFSYKDKKDKRREILSLTKKGYELINEIFPRNQKIIEDSFNNLNSNEMKDFVKLLKKIDNLKNLL